MDHEDLLRGQVGAPGSRVIGLRRLVVENDDASRPILLQRQVEPAGGDPRLDLRRRRVALGVPVRIVHGLRQVLNDPLVRLLHGSEVRGFRGSEGQVHASCIA